MNKQVLRILEIYIYIYIYTHISFVVAERQMCKGGTQG